MSKHIHIPRWIDAETFHADVEYIESCWQQRVIGTTEVPLIDIGAGDPLVFVPMLEHFEFVYVHQLRALSQERRVILYRRRELRTREFGRSERVEELRALLDGLDLERADLVGLGGAAIVLLEFALRYPHRCRSLTLLGQGVDYRPPPYQVVRLLQELYIRLPLEEVLPERILRHIPLNAWVSHAWDNRSAPALPRHLIEEQLCKIYQWPLVFKYSVLPLLYHFDFHRFVSEVRIPTLLINRGDDPLAPEAGTRWLAEYLPHCAGYHVVPGRERFFPYAQAKIVTPLIEAFLATRDHIGGPFKQLYQ